MIIAYLTLVLSCSCHLRPIRFGPFGLSDVKLLFFFFFFSFGLSKWKKLVGMVSLFWINDNKEMRFNIMM